MEKKVIKFIISIVITTMLTINFSTFANQAITHQVISGDTLWKLSQKYNVSIQEIMISNNLIDSLIIVGQKLNIPVPHSNNNNSIYTVKKGDVLWKIAYDFGITTNQLVNANKLEDYDYLYIGQKLNIPNYSQPPLSQENNTKPYITYKEYIVKKGDTVWTLSQEYGIPMDEILKANNLSLQSYLSIDQKILIPVHHIPLTSTQGPQYGEYLDWWTQVQYLFPIGAKAKVTDLITGKSYNVVRSYGAFHADCEPITSKDAEVMYEVWGYQWSWLPRASIVEVNGRKIAASVTNMPHDVENINNNNFKGHFDIHFLNSTRHVDNLISEDHQLQIKKAAGLK